MVLLRRVKHMALLSQRRTNSTHRVSAFTGIIDVKRCNTKPETIIMLTVDGGLFTSADHGGEWKPLNSFLKDISGQDQGNSGSLRVIPV